WRAEALCQMVGEACAVVFTREDGIHRCSEVRLAQESTEVTVYNIRCVVVRHAAELVPPASVLAQVLIGYDQASRRRTELGEPSASPGRLARGVLRLRIADQDHVLARVQRPLDQCLVTPMKRRELANHQAASETRHAQLTISRLQRTSATIALTQYAA